jgi:hypothetical protein
VIPVLTDAARACNTWATSLSKFIPVMVTLTGPAAIPYDGIVVTATTLIEQLQYGGRPVGDYATYKELFAFIKCSQGTHLEKLVNVRVMPLVDGSNEAIRQHSVEE